MTFDSENLYLINQYIFQASIFLWIIAALITIASLKKGKSIGDLIRHGSFVYRDLNGFFRKDKIIFVKISTYVATSCLFGAIAILVFRAFIR